MIYNFSPSKLGSTFQNLEMRSLKKLPRAILNKYFLTKFTGLNLAFVLRVGNESRSSDPAKNQNEKFWIYRSHRHLFQQEINQKKKKCSSLVVGDLVTRSHGVAVHTLWVPHISMPSFPFLVAINLCIGILVSLRSSDSNYSYMFVPFWFVEVSFEYHPVGSSKKKREEKKRRENP